MNGSIHDFDKPDGPQIWTLLRDVADRLERGEALSESWGCVFFKDQAAPRQTFVMVPSHEAEPQSMMRSVVRAIGEEFKIKVIVK